MSSMQSVPILISRDLDRAAEFYRRLRFDVQMYPHGGYLFAHRENLSLHLRQLGAGELPNGAGNPCGCYCYVPDADALHQEFTASGVPSLSGIRNEPWGMREFAVSDPDCNLLRIGSYLPK